MVRVLPLSAATLAIFLIAVQAPATHRPARPLVSHNVAIRVLDQDTGQPVAARIVVAPLEAIRGAKKIAEDTESGALSIRLPRGRYEVSAMHGPEFTVDRREVSFESGAPILELRLRRVIEPGAWVASDLHLHSSQSFDSRVPVEERLRSLAAAGVAFATPTEHNVVGTFPTALAERLGIAWAPAMEVTPSQPSVGHFSIFPYAGETAPIVQGIGAKELLTRLREEHPDALIQINHPRLNGNMGFFNVIRLDTVRGKNMALLPPQVDTVEILNGIELSRPGQFERTFREWIQLLERGRIYWGTSGSDVHHKGQAPGYPRTYIRPTSGSSPRALIQALRRGHSFVTTGPFLEMNQEDRVPGDTLVLDGSKATVQLRLRAAPWVSAQRIELWAGGKVVWSKELSSRPLTVGPPGANAEQQRKDAILFEESVSVELPENARTLVAVARGDQPLNRVTPLGAIPSVAITNPLLLPSKTAGPQPPR